MICPFPLFARRHCLAVSLLLVHRRSPDLDEEVAVLGVADRYSGLERYPGVRVSRSWATALRDELPAHPQEEVAAVAFKTKPAALPVSLRHGDLLSLAR